jgi:hypothetical protein
MEARDSFFNRIRWQDGLHRTSPKLFDKKLYRRRSAPRAAESKHALG